MLLVPWLEAAVVEALELMGHNCVTQLGVAGFFIDIAIRDPDRPEEYLLGIECDGASYHSTKSARDRDRLRQDILEDLGWQIERVWSMDWFQDPSADPPSVSWPEDRPPWRAVPVSEW
jgi:very-short-patch-repair endonuclease